MISSDARVIVLGGGLSGCLIAAGLQDRGVDVAIVEQHRTLMSAASRWNDGKIHLGYTFTGTTSCRSAELMQSGSAVFLDGLGRAIGQAIPGEWFGDGVIYLMDSESMVDVETLWLRAQRVGRLHDERASGEPGMRRYVRGQPYLDRLTVSQAEVETGQRRILGAWRAPARHVSARAVADSVAKALAERGTARTQGRVQRVSPCSGGWLVRLADD